MHEAFIKESGVSLVLRMTRSKADIRFSATRLDAPIVTLFHAIFVVRSSATTVIST